MNSSPGRPSAIEADVEVALVALDVELVRQAAAGVRQPLATRLGRWRQAGAAGSASRRVGRDRARRGRQPRPSSAAASLSLDSDLVLTGWLPLEPSR